MDCIKNSFYLDRRVLVSGRESAIHWDNFVELGFLPRFGKPGEVLVKCSVRDYHARWEDISNLVPSLNLIFHNGLTEASGDVVWGGVLDQNTVVDGGGTYSIEFLDLDEFTSISAGNSSIFAGNNSRLTSLNNTIINAGNNLNIGVGADMGVNVTDSYNIQSTDYTNVGTNSFNIEAPNLFTLTTNSVDMTEAFPGSFLQILDTTTGEAEWSNYSMPLTDGLEDQILVVQADGNLDWEYPEITDVGNTLFVSKLGDDSTAQRESLDKHYLTLSAANNAAQDGDIIIVYPGIYSIEPSQIAIKPNVNYEFKAGVFIDITVGLVTETPIKFGGVQSITGAGEIAIDFNNGIIVYDLSDRIVSGYNHISIELKSFKFNKPLLLKCHNVNQLDFRVKYVDAKEGLEVRELSPTSTISLEFNKVRYTPLGIGLYPLLRVSQMPRGGQVNIQIDDLFLVEKAIKSSVILTDQTEEGSVLNMIINKVTGTALLGDADLTDKLRYAFYENTLCFARKNIAIRGYEYGAVVYNPSTSYSTATDIEYGKYTIEATILNTGIGYSNFVSMNISNSSVVFELDLINLNNAGYVLLGDSDSPNRSYVHATGSLVCESSVNSPVIIGSVSDTTVFFRDFKVYARGTAASYSVDTTTIYASIALHNLNNRSNLDVEAAPIVPISQPIETLFVNALIR